MALQQTEPHWPGLFLFLFASFDGNWKPEFGRPWTQETENEDKEIDKQVRGAGTWRRELSPAGYPTGPSNSICAKQKHLVPKSYLPFPRSVDGVAIYLSAPSGLLPGCYPFIPSSSYLSLLRSLSHIILSISQIFLKSIHSLHPPLLPILCTPPSRHAWSL